MTEFGDEVLHIKLRCCHGQHFSFPMVTMSSLVISRALMPMTSKARSKLPLDTEPVVRDNVAPYSTDNRNIGSATFWEGLNAFWDRLNDLAVYFLLFTFILLRFLLK